MLQLESEITESVNLTKLSSAETFRELAVTEQNLKEFQQMNRHIDSERLRERGEDGEGSSDKSNRLPTNRSSNLHSGESTQNVLDRMKIMAGHQAKLMLDRAQDTLEKYKAQAAKLTEDIIISQVRAAEEARARAASPGVAEGGIDELSERDPLVDLDEIISTTVLN